MDTVFAHDVLQADDGHSFVEAQLGYLKRSHERPYDYASPPPAGMPWQNYESDTRTVRITDARTLEHSPTLHREGFELRQLPSALSDFNDEPAIRHIYYREAADLARAATGAQAAYVYDHLVRKRDNRVPALTFGRRVLSGKPSANGRVHNDYTEDSGARRAALVLPEQAVAIRRYAIVNIWRPLSEPVVDTPLAVCDARSVSPRDLVASDVHYATRTGEIYLVTYSPAHRWFYFSEMRRSEVLVFKQYDADPRLSRFVPHAAFEHPRAPDNAPPRESIEVRCLVVFD